MNKLLSAVILSCDNNYDISPQISNIYDACFNAGIKTVLVTENLKEHYSDREVVLSKDKSFAHKIRLAISSIDSEYVLILLDDYFIDDDLLHIKIQEWCNFLKKYTPDALRVSKITKKYIKKKKVEKSYYKLNRIRPYLIDFHPTIWKKSIIEEIINKKAEFTPWEIEPVFSLFLSDKHAYITTNTLNYSELIIGGKFFKKPYLKYCENYKGTRKILSSSSFLRYRFVRFIRDWTPPFLLNFLKRVLRIKSVSSSIEKEYTNNEK